MSLNQVTRRAALAGLGAAGAGVAFMGHSASAQSVEASTLADHPLCGVWLVMANAADPAAPQMGNVAYFWEDGTAMLAFPPTQLSPGGVQVNSSMHGIWKAKGDRVGNFTCVQLVSDIDGNYLGSTTVDGFPEVSEDLQTFTDDGSMVVVTLRDAAGAIVNQFSGAGSVPIRGMRMVFGAPKFPAPLEE
jgi:hypothetical protein